jgi:hypothetical protein
MLEVKSEKMVKALFLKSLKEHLGGVMYVLKFPPKMPLEVKRYINVGRRSLRIA